VCVVCCMLLVVVYVSLVVVYDALSWIFILLGVRVRMNVLFRVLMIACL